MEPDLYSNSLFWQAIDILSKASYFALPLLTFIICITQIKRKYSKLVLISFAGSLLTISAKMVHFTVDAAVWINLGYKHPEHGENLFLWFIYMHGFNIGMAVFLTAMSIHLFMAKNA